MGQCNDCILIGNCTEDCDKVYRLKHRGPPNNYCKYCHNNEIQFINVYVKNHSFINNGYDKYLQGQCTKCKKHIACFQPPKDWFISTDGFYIMGYIIPKIKEAKIPFIEVRKYPQKFSEDIWKQIKRIHVKDVF